VITLALATGQLDSIEKEVIRQIEYRVRCCNTTTDNGMKVDALQPAYLFQIMEEAGERMYGIVASAIIASGKEANRPEIEKFLYAGTGFYRSAIEHYVAQHNDLVQYHTLHKDGSVATTNAGMICGAIGAVFLGPLGAVLGGALGGGAVGNEIETQRQQKLQNTVNALSAANQQAITCLADVKARAIHILQRI
jgi:hypothetical protein